MAAQLKVARQHLAHLPAAAGDDDAQRTALGIGHEIDGRHSSFLGGSERRASAFIWWEV
jgi:hypothetical protein